MPTEINWGLVLIAVVEEGRSGLGADGSSGGGSTSFGRQHKQRSYQWPEDSELLLVFSLPVPDPAVVHN